MRILGIETSCDETAASVVDAQRRILSNVIFSQIDAHQAYGGVVPEIAARAHLQRLEAIVTQALQEAKIKRPDAIAVTAGPGLIGGVIVGVMAAKSYASVWNLPIYAINHLQAHALSARLTESVDYPYMLALLSGGHCQVLVVRGASSYALLGQTHDDALGEAFDKTAKLLGLPYPGGPALEALATQGDNTRFPLPRPLHGKAGCDFSFSGLKTAVRLVIEQLRRDQAFDYQAAADVAASFQHTVAAILTDRLSKALIMATSMLGSTPPVVIAGGVAANRYLRARLEAFAQMHATTLVVPPVALCTDNAAMIAWAAHEKIMAKIAPDTMTFDAKARWELSPPK